MIDFDLTPINMKRIARKFSTNDPPMQERLYEKNKTRHYTRITFIERFGLLFLPHIIFYPVYSVPFCQNRSSRSD